MRYHGLTLAGHVFGDVRLTRFEGRLLLPPRREGRVSAAAGAKPSPLARKGR